MHVAEIKQNRACGGGGVALYLCALKARPHRVSAFFVLLKNTFNLNCVVTMCAGGSLQFKYFIKLSFCAVRSYIFRRSCASSPMLMINAVVEFFFLGGK